MKKTTVLIISGLFLYTIGLAQEKVAGKEETPAAKSGQVQTSEPGKVAIGEKGTAKDAVVKPKACCAHGAKSTKGCGDKTGAQAHDKSCTMPCCAQKNKDTKEPAN